MNSHICSFPRTDPLQKKWLNALSIDKEHWIWSKNKLVCSEHFKEKDFFITSGRRTLRPNSVPLQKLTKATSSSLSCSLNTSASTSKSTLQESILAYDVEDREQRRKRKLDVRYKISRYI